VLQCVAVCCSVLQCVEVKSCRYYFLARPAEGDANGCLESFLYREESTLYVSIFIYVYTHTQVQVFFCSRGLREVMPTECVAVRCSVLLQCVAQRVAVCCSALQCAAVCCSALQCAAVRCSALQCVAVSYMKDCSHYKCSVPGSF